MLPSTGLFKATNCSFYDSGLCERPYCHFRHVKKDSSCSLEADEEVLEQLVSDAVQKVLQNSELPSSSFPEQHPHKNFVSDVVENELPIKEETECTQLKTSKLASAVPSYKPTPIAELNKKRHIPVPYSPRNSSSLQPKRQISADILCTPKVNREKLLPESPITPSSEYNPDVDTNKCVGYSPSLPKNQTNGTSNLSYIPSAIANLISPATDYVPTGNNDQNMSYEPSGKQSQEPEYKPHFDSACTLLPSNYTPTDKAVLDELNLDEFSTELELLDEIIYEHSESVNKKNLEEFKTDVTTACLENFEKNVANSSEDTKKGFSSFNPNNILTLNNANVPNDAVSNDPIKKEDEIKKERKHSSKRSSHVSSRTKSSSSSKTKSSSPALKSEKSKSKQDGTKSHVKLDNSKEHKSSRSTKSEKKSRSSSTSKDHKSASRSKESRSSSRSKKHSKHSKRKRSPDREKESSVKADAASVSDHNGNSNEPMSDPDDSEIEEECFKIFQEYAPEAASTKSNQPPVQKSTETEQVQVEPPSKKLRVAHHGSTQSLSKLMAQPQRSVTNPALAMVQRLQELRESYELKVSEKEARTTLLMRRVELGGLLTNHTSTPSNPTTKDSHRGPVTSSSTVTKAWAAPSNKHRIAHVPNVPNLLEEKTRVQSSKQALHQRLLLKNKIQSGQVRHTTAQSAAKGSQRSAHVPSLTQLQRPLILPETGSKIPASIRQRHLDILVKEYENFMSREESYKKAAEAEKTAYSKSNNKTIYVSSVTGAIMRLRKEQGSSAPPCTSGVLHHAAMLGGTKRGQWSVIKPRKPATVSLYEHTLRYKLTEEQLAQHGFPRRHPTLKGTAVSTSTYDKNLPWQGSARICIRCSRHYEVDSQGVQIGSEECLHHWGRFWKATYRCCGGGTDSPTCSVASCHITHNFKMNDTGFVETLPSSDEPSDGDFGIYALDCEMVYTTKGVELARVTVVDRNLHMVYDALVKPSNPILDYTTRFSGITEEQLQDVTTSIFTVQATLLSIFNSKTILIGHSLDSDLRALKLIHDCVVDTSIVFPHERHTDYKSSLRHLALKHLNRLIQESVEGHNSAEDAIAAMDLMLYRVKEDLKTS